MSTPAFAPATQAAAPLPDAGTWARGILEGLVAAGVRTVVLGSGARSAPLALAAGADARLSVVDLVDERAGAFFALGVARATGAPAALVTTSGSAGGHALPAVMEADAAGLPLVIVTADRPPALHGRGAPQTCEQTTLFTGFLRARLDAGAPDTDGLPGLAERIAAAVSVGLGPTPGPVHLNVGLRAPLFDAAPQSPRRLGSHFAPRAGVDPAAVVALAELVTGDRHGLVLVGPDAHVDPAVLGAFAVRLGWPVLAEAASGLAHGALEGRIAAPDRTLGHAAFDPAMTPEVIFQLGAAPVGWGVKGAMARWAQVPRACLHRDRYVDPTGGGALSVRGELTPLFEALLARLPDTEADASWRARWMRAGMAAQARAEDLARGTFDEASVAWALSRHVPGGTQLLLGNGLSVRSLDPFAHHLDPSVTVLTQRGLSGIDGLVAGAAGAAFGSGRPVWALLGDVSFQHDLGGLAAAALASRQAALRLVVVDNAGGRIFEHLPGAPGVDRAHFEAHLVMPPAYDDRAAARAFGATVHEARDLDALTRILSRPNQKDGLEVVFARLRPHRPGAVGPSAASPDSRRPS